MTNNYANKRFLITQPMIYGYNGSTMVTVELAEYLQSQGGEVTVYTYAYYYPIKSEVDSKNIKVVVASDDDKLSLSDFDYIWVHSQVLPLSIVDDLADKLPQKMPKFIFLHMLPFEWIPDERPYIYQMEQKLASQVLVISEEVRDVLEKCFDDNYRPRYEYFRNPAPESFASYKHSYNRGLKNVLIVTNHPAGELMEAAKILNRNGVNVKTFGELGDEYKSITPNILDDFDVVVTIGKTVQYCLTMGKPVYIYDVHGGCGYLNENNFSTAMHYNFSGRGFAKKSPDDIAAEIMKKYDYRYYKSNRNKFIKQFSIANVADRIFSDDYCLEVKRLSNSYAESIRCCQISARRDFCKGLANYKQANTINDITKNLDDVTRKLHSCEAERDKYKKEASELWNSHSYQIGRKLTKLPSLVKKRFRGH